MRYYKYSKNLKLILLTSSLLGSLGMHGQEKEPLTLTETLLLAKQKSLDAFRAKRQYAVDYWEFRSYKASLLPQVDLYMEPFTYNRSFVKRYDDDNNIDVYRLQQNLNTFAEVSITQNVPLTGATVFASSSLNRLVNYGTETFEDYNATPLRIGIIQPIMAFNSLKWEKITAPLEVLKAEKDFLAKEQETNIKTVNLFFNWALAETKLEIARENQINTARLYDIGKKRYELGSVQKDDLLNLELESFTAVTDLTRAELNLQAVRSDLKIFLNLDDFAHFEPQLPEVISDLKIDVDKALNLAQANNPELLEANIQKIKAERDLEQVVRENRFDLSLNASYGLNQQAYEFTDAYRNFLDQQIVSVQFNIPLLDWGERKGNIKTAKMTRELSDIQTEQAENDIQQQILEAVHNFNLQHDQVVAALRARTISRESYEITEKRFLSGNVDLLRLLNSREAWQRATEQYVQSLQNYWSYYYEVQKLTLFNFRSGVPLKEDFEQLLQG